MILDFEGNAQLEHLQQMMEAIKHRGPNASRHLEKFFGGGTLFLGSNRLQIIDKDSHSNQPFVSQDGRYALVFNGEIYNYEELRNELLAKGTRFTTRSDTEVLLYWLIVKGKEGIGRLNGMFAFVFVDFLSTELIIARDKLGIKPLFAARTNNKLIISSEIKGVLASGLINKELNEEAIPHYLAYKYAPKPATFFKNIEEIMPGTIWQVNAKGKVVESIIKDNVEGGERDIHQLLIDSVVQQYSESNNTGIMLSGGVDSTLLLAILNQELGYRNIPIFSIANRKKNKYDTKDGTFSAKAAKLYQAEYNEIGIDHHSLRTLDNYIKTLGQPIADSGGFLTWLVAEKASGKSNVLLSGAGADELFGGYNRHKAFHTYLIHKGKPWFNLLKRGKRVPSFSAKLNQLRKFANAIDTDPSTTFNNFLQSDTFRINSPLWELNLTNEKHLRKALEFDQQNYLAADVLAITDHSTMQHSVETRVPYLDTQLFKATQNLSIKELLKKEQKWLLKGPLINYGGKEFASRKKQGFGLPMNDWLKNEMYWEFNSNDQLIHTFVSQQKIETLRKIHSSGKENLTQELWRMLLLHKWLAHNF